MRSTYRLLATAIKPLHLTPGNPTGLTGLLTHPTPRKTLMKLYCQTLDLLSKLPTHSAYRTSTLALTKSRLSIVEAVKPAGYEEWRVKAEKLLEEHPEAFNRTGNGVESGGLSTSNFAGRSFVSREIELNGDPNAEVEWDGEEVQVQPEGTRTMKERKGQADAMKGEVEGDRKRIDWVDEPPLEIRQIEEIESKIGAGLIEEVIQVAMGELKLVEVMIEGKLWEPLSDKAPPGQWEYFSRDRHTGGTQATPPK